MIVGYVRAIREADRMAQRRALEAEDIRRIYSDSCPATALERPTLAEAIHALDRGDTLCAAHAAALAGTVGDLVSVLDRVQARGANLVLIDLGGSHMDSSTAVGKLMLRMLRSVAAFEREARDERQSTRFFGRKAKARDQRQTIVQMKADDVGATEIAKRLRIDRKSVYRQLTSD